MPYIPKSGQVLGATCYVDGELVAAEVGFTTPEVAHVSIDVQVGGGTISVPSPLTDAFTSTITKQGVDSVFAQLLGLKPRTIEFRWVEQEIDADGATENVSLKAFLTGLLSTIPGIEPAIGERADNAIQMNVTRYRLIRDGVEVLDIDKISGVNRQNGVDYFDGLASLL